MGTIWLPPSWCPDVSRHAGSCLYRSFFKKTKNEKFLLSAQPDAYDMMVRELGFEMKAQPSNRMKTEEELAKEEQERLQKLEVWVWPWP